MKITIRFSEVDIKRAIAEKVERDYPGFVQQATEEDVVDVVWLARESDGMFVADVALTQIEEE